jgi:glycosyltransferase involved in cell wall biosynthesis
VRIAVVGPTHPYKGGVAAHTTSLAQHLAAAGHDTVLVSWSRLYPHGLYPGEQAVPDGDPDVPPFERTTRTLRWDRPGSWWRVGRRLREADLLVVVLVLPAQVPALLALVRAARSGGGRRPRVVVLAHNVVPHETHVGGQWLVTRLLSAADAVLVHSAAMGEQAAAHGAHQVRVAGLPPHLPGGVPAGPASPRRGRARPDDRLAVLALGIVREYKGVDLLVEAAAQVSQVHLGVVGEQWGRAGERVRALVADPRLAGRVELQRGYLPGRQVAGLLAGYDVLALPYRHATASQNVLLAHAHGLVVLATEVGTFGEQVRDGVDGLLVPPSDVAALVAALRRLTEPGELERLQAGVPPVDPDGPWRRYLSVLLDGSHSTVGQAR